MSHSPNQMLSGVYVSLEDGEPRLALHADQYEENSKEANTENCSWQGRE